MSINSLRQSTARRGSNLLSSNGTVPVELEDCRIHAICIQSVIQPQPPTLPTPEFPSGRIRSTRDQQPARIVLRNFIRRNLLIFPNQGNATVALKRLTPGSAGAVLAAPGGGHSPEFGQLPLPRPAVFYQMPDSPDPGGTPAATPFLPPPRGPQGPKRHWLAGPRPSQEHRATDGLPAPEPDCREPEYPPPYAPAQLHA